MENGGSVDGTGSLPLDDIRVVDLTIARAGPQCVRQLADWGADVVRIEHPADPAGVGGSDARNLHRNKRTVALDLKGGGAIEQLLLLTDHADVFVENMRPSVKQRLGIGWDVLHPRNPRLVYGSISGFGQDGPYADRGGVDQIVGAKRTTCGSPSGVAASRRAPSGRSVTMSSFHWTPRRGSAEPASSGSSVASGSQPCSSRPTCWPRGLRAAVPPSATATTWWPRQIPSVGTLSATASRTISFSGVSQGASASSLAPTEPPSTTSASYDARAGSASPSYGRHSLDRAAGVLQPATHVGRWAGGLVLDDEDDAGSDHRTGSIRSRSKAETWPRYSSHSARLLRRKKS